MKTALLLVILLVCSNSFAEKNKLRRKPAQAFATKKISAKKPAPKVATKKIAPQKPKEKRPVDLSRSVRVQYADPSWNRSTTQIDTGSIVIRDTNTGKMVRVQMSETGTDSGAFAGIYSISWNEVQTSKPEIYGIPPEKSSEKIEATSLDKLKRLPYIFKRDEKEQTIEAYTSREEAESALAAYKQLQEQKLKKSEDISESLIETAEKSKKDLTEKKRLEDQRKREQARNDSLLEQTKKIELAKADFYKLSKADQDKRHRDAKALMQVGMEFYRANQFEPAEQNFKKAFDLDPTSDDLCFYYGVTLYKRDKFNEALVYLELAKKGSFNPLERDFFKGLNYFRLDEHEHALEIFSAIKATQDKTFGPTAAFYQGLVKMKLEKYDEAKDHFQEVLDTSSDPALDQSAEDYIEKIERLKAFLKQKSKKLFFSATIGMQYDSNVLLTNSSSSTSSDPSKIADTRTLGGISVEYRPVYADKYEFSVKGKTDYMYSTKGENAGADPLLYSVKAPYKYKSTLFGKGYKLEVVPGIEKLLLDEDKSGATSGITGAYGQKDNYLYSTTFDWLNNFVMADDHIMAVNLKYRTDRNDSQTAVGDSDPTATKWGLNWQNILFFSSKKNLGLIGDLGYSMNKATGKSLTYNRYDASAMMLFPVPWEFQGVGGIAYYQANYPDKTPQSRTDSNLALSLNFIRPLTDWLNMTVSGSYTNNASNLDANTYNKYLLMTVFTANWSL